MLNISSFCQHIDSDGIVCPSSAYLACPHCQLNICLKHVNLHQEYLREEFLRLCEDINRTHSTLDHLTFDPHRQRDFLIKELDRWHTEETRALEKFYLEKRKQIDILCIKSQIQFDIYRCQKEKQFRENLQKQVERLLRQEQIHRDDLDQLQSKLKSIRCGLEELQQLNIQIRYRPSQHNVSVSQWPYVEAAKVSDPTREREEGKTSTDKIYISSFVVAIRWRW